MSDYCEQGVYKREIILFNNAILLVMRKFLKYHCNLLVISILQVFFDFSI